LARVVFFRTSRGRVPFLEWLEDLPEAAQISCVHRIELISRFGHRLRRPYADTLRSGIHELRVSSMGVNYRMLYFFHGRTAVVVSHGIIKQEARVPPLEIMRALVNKAEFESDPAAHSHEEMT
jgi:phage-related protein